VTDYPALGAAILAAIDARVRYALRQRDRDRLATDRRHVERALTALARTEEGLRQHAPDDFHPAMQTCAKYGEEWPCPDARRYAAARDDAIDGLADLARLYGVATDGAP
jgi:MoaA/NifB/PqqE/SkfB family radical SAM enzyme